MFPHVQRQTGARRRARRPLLWLGEGKKRLRWHAAPTATEQKRVPAEAAGVYQLSPAAVTTEEIVDARE
jgi:hypothetical protein